MILGSNPGAGFFRVMLQSPSGLDGIKAGLWIFDLARFLNANRPSPAEAGYGRRRPVSTSLENALMRGLLQKLDERLAILLQADDLLGHLGAGRKDGRADLE